MEQLTQAVTEVRILVENMKQEQERTKQQLTLNDSYVRGALDAIQEIEARMKRTKEEDTSGLKDTRTEASESTVTSTQEVGKDAGSTKRSRK